MDQEYKGKVDLHHKLLLGDPENFNDQPGLLVGMKEANKTLAEIRTIGIAAIGIILSGFLTSLMYLVYQAHP